MLVSDCVALRLLLLGLVVTWLVTGFPGLTTKVGRVWSTSDCHCGRGLPPAFTGRRAVLDRRPELRCLGLPRDGDAWTYIKPMLRRSPGPRSG
jgi:hypothetical protein